MNKLLRTLWPASVLAILTLLLTMPSAFAQAPNLGTAATYGAFSGSGAIGNTGLTVITGDIGTYVGSFTGFPPGQYTGAKHVADATALSVKNDLTLAYNSLNDATHAVIYDTVLNATMGNGQVLTPRTYRRGDLTTLSGNLTFDAMGNSSAIFIIKIGAALNVAKNTTIILANNAQAANIYWAVDGAVSILDNTIFKGTILANGAIHLYGGASLEGRALAVVGAVTMASNLVAIPGSAPPANHIVVITPAPGDTVKGNSPSYQITWGGSGITSNKTFEYSLDSGLTWTSIGSVTSDAYAYTWHVPDTASRKALVRITDANNLRGVSGLFTIGSSKIIVIHPAKAEVIPGATQAYQITWTGTALTSHKTFEYSLDSGSTWKTIDTSSTDLFTHSWNVPDTGSTRAIVRITDKNGITGKSGMFTIRSSKIIVTHPALAAILTGGTPNYQITWTGAGLTPKKTFALSLDSGLTWTTIGTISADVFAYSWNVPDTLSTKAMIRITDSNGITGRSGVFSILSSKVAAIVVTRPTAGETIAGGTQAYQITWTGSQIASQKTFTLSLDAGVTWTTIGVLTADVFTYSWNVPDTTSTRALIRITDKNGVVGTSGLFTILSNGPAALVVISPELGEVIVGGSQNYMIVWTGSKINAQKTIEYSLDAGATWKMIGAVNADLFTYSWNVPDTTSNQALVRVTDKNGVRGISGMFRIISSKVPVIVVTHPAAGAKLAGGTMDYPITWTGAGIATMKTFELSLDNGLTWSLIGVLHSDQFSYGWNVPDTASTMAIVRITDSTGLTGQSGVFTITSTHSVGSINSLTLSGLTNNNIGNLMVLGIAWTFTPDIGTSVLVEYLLDNQHPWTTISNVPTSETPSAMWMTPTTGNFPAVLIRVTSTKGMTMTSQPFSIGSTGAVADARTLGYSLSNYPNPASGQTTIAYTLPVASDVALTVIDGMGRDLMTIESRNMAAGSHTMNLDATRFESGAYTYRLIAGGVMLTGRMDIVR